MRGLRLILLFEALIHHSITCESHTDHSHGPILRGNAPIEASRRRLEGSDSYKQIHHANIFNHRGEPLRMCGFAETAPSDVQRVDQSGLFRGAPSGKGSDNSGDSFFDSVLAFFQSFLDFLEGLGDGNDDDDGSNGGNDDFTADEIIAIDVYYHVIRSSQSPSDSEIRNQHDMLNTGFSNSPFRFQLKNIGRHSNDNWYDYREFEDDVPMKRALRRGGRETLNIYVNAATDFCGYAYLPQDIESITLTRDGVVVNEACFVGGVGATLTHEAGHWLGLSHTFNNGCSSPGDGVDDTPAQRVPTNGCPTSRPDTCTGGGPDLVDNIMDYGACRDKFTQGQMLKMTNDWFRYRS